MQHEKKIRFIKDNPDMKNELLANFLGCSLSTINVLKKKAGTNKDRMDAKSAAQLKAKILRFLEIKERSANAIAEHVKYSTQTVRNHLYTMQNEGKVIFDNSKGGNRCVWRFVTEDDRSQKRASKDPLQVPMSQVGKLFDKPKKTGH